MTIADNDRIDNPKTALGAMKSSADDFREIRSELVSNGEFTGEILEDKTPFGKDRGWREKKLMAIEMSSIYNRLADKYVSKTKTYRKRAENLCDCGSQLIYKACPEGHEKHLIGSFFCRIRLCPICSWRRALKHGHQAKRVLHDLVELYPNQQFLFLTLTVKNCRGDDLKAEINRLLKSWDKLSRRKFFKQAVRGWFRALEVTYSLKRKDFHPHIHVILAVTPNYFGRDYVKQERWVKEWQSALQVDYAPVVDVRKAGERKRIGEKRGETLAPKERAKLVAEASKYTVKSTDILRGSSATQEFVLKILDDALARRKLVAYGGELLEIFKKLNYEEVDETTDLVNIDEDEKTKRCNCKTCGSELVNVLYQWCDEVGNHVAKEVPKYQVE